MEQDVILVGHNIKFDLKWLAKAGLDLTKVLVWDTMIAEKVLLGNNPNRERLDLGSVARKYGLPGKEAVVDKMIKAGVCPSHIPQSLLKRRCIYDVRATANIFLKQREVVREAGKLGVVLTRCLFTPVLADMEEYGLCLDAQRVMDEYNRASQELAVVEDELKSIADINWNSSKQVGETLYGKALNYKELKKYGKVMKTKGGAPLTDLDTVMRLTSATKKQKRFREAYLLQSKLNAQLTKALDKFKACIDADDLLYADFHQTVTVTHRLSSTGTKYRAQLQNLHRMFKPLFKSRHNGWKMVEVDGASLEFRVAVEMADDEQGRIDLLDPSFDAHRFSASQINGTDMEDVTDEQRQNAKAHTFKPLYGGSKGNKNEERYYQAFKDRYTGIAELQRGWCMEALHEGTVTLPTGFQFYFPFTKITKSGYQTDTTSICNYPVQSFATADIIPIALVYLWHTLKAEGMQAMIVNTVHDSAILEAPEEEHDKLNAIMRDSFTIMCYNYIKRIYSINFKTSLGVGIKWGDYWSEGKEITEDVPNPNLIQENKL
jgi:DNA polymerase I-like protein with 3'-5' exonuclease and polymerase domains